MNPVNESSEGRWLSRMLTVSALGVLVAATFVGAALRDGEAALERSEVAFDAGRVPTALREARVAAASAVPFAPHVRLADARIRAIAIGAESTGNELLARQAWAALRGAALERQHPFAPEPAIEEADQQLARLLARAHEAKKERTFSADELLTELRAARPGLLMPLVSSGALMPLVVLGLVLLRRRRASASLSAPEVPSSSHGNDGGS